MEKRVMPWASWEQIALPKYLGGWGLKNIFQFSKDLAAKVGWCLLSTTSLWTGLVWHKYIAPTSLFDWIRAPKRRESGMLVIWKAVLASLDVIRLGLVWKVGNGRSVHIGIDPWLGCNFNHIFP